MQVDRKIPVDPATLAPSKKNSRLGPLLPEKTAARAKSAHVTTPPRRANDEHGLPPDTIGQGAQRGLTKHSKGRGDARREGYEDLGLFVHFRFVVTERAEGLFSSVRDGRATRAVNERLSEPELVQLDCGHVGCVEDDGAEHARHSPARNAGRVQARLPRHRGERDESKSPSRVRVCTEKIYN